MCLVEPDHRPFVGDLTQVEHWGVPMRAVIVGAGIAGLSLAKGLSLLGWQAEVYEQAAELKPLGAGLTLSANALKALACLDLYRKVVDRAQRVDRLSVLDQKGAVIQSTDHTRTDQQNDLLSMVAIHRGDLQDVLSSALLPGTIHLGMECSGVRFSDDDGRARLAFKNGRSVTADIVFACDGIHSALRKVLFPDSHERFAGYMCWRAIARGTAEKEADLTESWGDGLRFGMVPLPDETTYWFACCPASRPEDPALARAGLPVVESLFSHFHAPVRRVLRQTRGDALIRNDIFDIDPIPRFFEGPVVFLGDAAHAVTPDLGQGAGLAIEDAAILCALLGRQGGVEAFRAYNAQRRPRAARIARSSRFFAGIAQLKHPLAVGLRNSLARLIPTRLLDRYTDSILAVELAPIRRSPG